MDSGNLDGIIKRAEDAQRKESRQARRKNVWKRLAQRWGSLKDRPVDPYGFRAYWAFSPTAFTGMWPMGFWMSGMLTGLLYVIMGKDSYGPSVVLVFAALTTIFAAVLSARYAMTVLTYPSYRGWKSRLPFTVNGWERLFAAKHALSLSYWRLGSSVRIDFTPEATQEQKTIDAMLYVFQKEANSWFYEPDGPVAGFAGDPREPWKRMGNELHGSLCRGTITEIYRLLNQFAELQRKRRVVQSITITAGSREVHIDPPSYSPNP